MRDGVPRVLWVRRSSSSTARSRRISPVATTSVIAVRPPIAAAAVPAPFATTLVSALTANVRDTFALPMLIDVSDTDVTVPLACWALSAAPAVAGCRATIVSTASASVKNIRLMSASAGDYAPDRAARQAAQPLKHGHA